MYDYYEESAEFIDMMIAPWWEGPGALLPGALEGAGQAQGPIVDVGAGSGRAAELLHRDFPDSEILALEPSPAMRSALFARLLPREELSKAVTVLPLGLLEADLPESVRAFVLMNVLGHFSPAERGRVWELIAGRLSPEGRAVVNLAPPFSPVSVPTTAMADIPFGANRYEGWAAAEPAAEDRLTWTMTYAVSGPHLPRREITVNYDWWTLTPEALTAETAGHGLACTPHGPEDAGFFVLRPAG